MTRFAIFITVLTFAGCASKAADAPPQAAAPSEPAPATWKEAHTKEQRAAFMKATVVPAIGPLFQAYDAKGFADFDCKTCHGPEFKNSPKQFLPALTFKGDHFEECVDDAQICQFMGEKVVPAMAQALGEEPYNMQTHKGFGCGGCHAVSAQ